MIPKHQYTAFWNTLNELSSPGNGTVLRLYKHAPTEKQLKDGDYYWEGMALYSADMVHRYVLTRIWDRSKPLLAAVLLNPSTATEYAMDPTVMRVVERVRNDDIHGGVVVMNIFAFRATDPDNMRKAKDPVGRENNNVLLQLLPHCIITFCGWGVNGSHMDRHKHVEALIRRMGITPWILDLTKSGYPVHPLYQSYAKKLKPWR